jgi:hypothetical protein
MRIAAIIAAALFTTGGLAAAERVQAAIRHYQLDIPRQTLDNAIKELAQQTGLQIARLSDTIDGNVMVGPVKGNRTPEEALQTLLTHDLRYKVVNDTTIAIIDAKDDRPGGIAPPVHEGTSVGDSQTLSDEQGSNGSAVGSTSTSVPGKFKRLAGMQVASSANPSAATQSGKGATGAAMSVVRSQPVARH